MDFAQLIKLYGPDLEADTRYSPPAVIGTEVKPILGDPDPQHVSTSHVERNNLTMRMQMRRFTRLTNGFSKKITNLRYAVALHMVHYNFCRPHRSLGGQTPAMRAGLATERMTLDDLSELRVTLARREAENRVRIK